MSNRNKPEFYICVLYSISGSHSRQFDFDILCMLAALDHFYYSDIFSICKQITERRDGKGEAVRNPYKHLLTNNMVWMARFGYGTDFYIFGNGKTANNKKKKEERGKYSIECWIEKFWNINVWLFVLFEVFPCSIRARHEIKLIQ